MTIYVTPYILFIFGDSYYFIIIFNKFGQMKMAVIMGRIKIDN